MEIIKNVGGLLLGFFVESIRMLIATALPFTKIQVIYYSLVAVYYVLLVFGLRKLWKADKKVIFFIVLAIALVLNIVGFIMAINEFSELLKEAVKPVLG